MRLLLTFTLLLATVAAQAAGEPLRFHYPDSGAPPWLHVAPGAPGPTGVVADVLARVAKAAGRTVRYEFQPREGASDALRNGSADGAMFFTVTRPPAREVLQGEPVVDMTALLVTDAGRRLGYERPADLRDIRLCTLTDESYPPLTLLAMNGTLLQRKAKTEQAQLMMLRDGSCAAAVINGPMFHWLSARYGWDDLRSEPVPLLEERLVLGFAPRERELARVADREVRRLRESGELQAILRRHGVR